jgi:hypothetical protein
MSNKNGLFKILSSAVIFAMVCALIPISRYRDVMAQVNPGYIRQVQVLEPDKTGLKHPVGIFFSSRANSLQVVEGQSSPDQSVSYATDIVSLNAFGRKAGSVHVQATIENPLNVIYDVRDGRMLLYRSADHQLLSVHDDVKGTFKPNTLAQMDASPLGLVDPQGMTMDGQGRVWVLDAKGPRLVMLNPDHSGSYDADQAGTINLSRAGLGNLRGIAYDSATGNLQLLNPIRQKLYEVTQVGQVVSVRDLSGLNLSDPQAITFAPSGDQTDEPQQQSLFVADGSSGDIVEISLSDPRSGSDYRFYLSIGKNDRYEQRHYLLTS